MSRLQQVRVSGIALNTPNGGVRSTPNSPDDAKWAYGLAGGGEMGARIRAFDWSKTPLGPIGQWPTSLLEVVSVCLRSRFLSTACNSCIPCTAGS